MKKNLFLTSFSVLSIMASVNANADINVTPGTTDITNDVVSAVVNSTDVADAVLNTVWISAITPYSDGSYTPITWDAENALFVEGEPATAAYANPGGAPVASGTVLTGLTTGDTTLAAYNGGSYTLDTSDSTTVSANPIVVDATAYSYSKKSADGLTTTPTSLTAADVATYDPNTHTADALSTAGYDYNLASITAANGGSDYADGSITSLNVSASAPDITKYYYFDENGDPVYFAADTQLEDLIGNPAALDVFANGYAVDKQEYEKVSGNYIASNADYQAKIADVVADQGIVNAAIESYKNEYAVWSANNQSYNAYTTAGAAKTTYNTSLASVIDTKDQTTLASAQAYADGLAVNYATAAQGAKADTALQASDLAAYSTTAEIEAGIGALISAKETNISAQLGYDVTKNPANTSEANSLVSRLHSSDTSIVDAINTNYDAIALETTRAEAAEGTLQSNIDAEAGTRAAADIQLQSNIDAEAGTRAAADTQLQSNIDAEANTRAAADTQLQSNIVAEAGTRAAADTALQTKIDNEVARATAQEAAIRGEIAAGDALTLTKANAYTDSKVNALEKNVSGGVAAATALSAVNVANVGKGEVSVGGGYGYYNSQSAMAFGAAMGLSDKWSVNAGAGIAQGDKTQFSIRAGTNYKFKLF